MRRGLPFLLVLGGALLLLPAGAGLPVADATDDGAADAHGSRTARPPIVILDDTQFTPAQGVVDGSGTPDDPYVISGWEIDGQLWAPPQPVLPSSPFPPGIFIQGTEAHVVIEDNHILDNPRAQIQVEDAEHVTIRGNVLERTADAPRRAPFDDGVALEDVQDVTVKDNLIRHQGAPDGLNGILAVSEVRSQRNLQDITIEDNVVVNEGDFAGTAHGIIVDGGSHVAVDGNTIRNEGTVDLHQSLEIRNLTHVSVTDNTARRPGPAASSEGFHGAVLDDATVARNSFDDQDVGLQVQEGIDVRYEENGFQDHADVGMRLQDGFRPTLRSNDVSSAGTDLVLDGVREATVSGNALSGSGQGLSVLGETVDAYDHDVAANNTVDGEPVRYLVGESGWTIDGSSLDAGYLAIVASTDVTLDGTPDLPANGQGLLVAGGRNVSVDAGNLSGHGTSLKVVGGREHTVDNLTATDAVLRSTVFANVTESTLSGAQGDGLVLESGSREASVRNVTIRNHGGVGLVVDRSDGTEVRDAVVEGNGGGILAEETEGLAVNGSSIAFNADYGLKAVDEVAPDWTQVDATENWWGDSDGPEGFEDGDGNAIVEATDRTDIIVDPVLTSPPGDAGDPDPG